VSRRRAARRHFLIGACTLWMSALLACAGAATVCAQPAPYAPPTAAGAGTPGPTPLPPPVPIAPPDAPGPAAPAPPEPATPAPDYPPAPSAPAEPAAGAPAAPVAALPGGPSAAAAPPTAAAGALTPVAAAAAPPAPAAAPDARQLAAIEAESGAPEVRQNGPRCLLNGLCFGPVLTLGLLDVFGIGAQARMDYWGVAFDYQFVHFTASDIPITLSLLTVEGRLYPFGGAFFLAGGLAWQHASLKGHVTYGGSSSVPPLDTDVTGRVNVPVLKLGLGLMGRSGFVLGFDLAFGIQLGRNTVSLESDLPRIAEVVAIEQKIRDRADKWVRAIPFLLQLNLIRVGFFF